MSKSPKKSLLTLGATTQVFSHDRIASLSESQKSSTASNGPATSTLSEEILSDSQHDRLTILLAQELVAKRDKVSASTSAPGPNHSAAWNADTPRGILRSASNSNLRMMLELARERDRLRKEGGDEVGETTDPRVLVKTIGELRHELERVYHAAVRIEDENAHLRALLSIAAEAGFKACFPLDGIPKWN